VTIRASAKMGRVNRILRTGRHKPPEQDDPISRTFQEQERRRPRA